MFVRSFAIFGVVCLLIAGAGAWLYHATAVPTTKATGSGGLFNWGAGNNRDETVEVERTEYHPPPPVEDSLQDDRLEDKNPTFDPALVDRRPLGPSNGWRLNASAAVLRLDVPHIRPDAEPGLLTLYPSYAAAVKAAGVHGSVLASVNLVDGKAKQFDDGLYAALDQAYYQGLDQRLAGHIGLVQRLYERVGPQSPAAPWLAAGLALAGVDVTPADRAAKEGYLSGFRANEVLSKPISFYTWNETLSACFRFLRFFQEPFPLSNLAIPNAVAAALAADPALLADYHKAMTFFARLTNPYRYLTCADLIGKTPEEVAVLAQGKTTMRGTVALFPASTAKETVLFERLFPVGLPANADLMRELIAAIRSGKVSLQPKSDSGWYDHQVHALETLLLPEKGEGSNKLLLTKAYKKRLVEAFQALMTKRRETHARQLDFALPMEAARPPAKVQPRLRLEPNPSYYLRTARAYAFLLNFLEASVGPEVLKSLHGLRQGGTREPDLATELRSMRDLFYGFYLVCAEDIGLKPTFANGETVDVEACYGAAAKWQSAWYKDPDLAIDTRVSVPVFVDVIQRKVTLWATLGVRLAKLEASYVRPPSMKPAKGEAAWEEVAAEKLEAAHYLIPVDEFAEVAVKGLRVLTREELRTICDRHKTKEAIVQALR